MKDAVIFDLDGTLWDARPSACILWNRILAQHDEISYRMTEELVTRLMGLTMEEIGEMLFPDFSEDSRKRIVDAYGVEEVRYLYQHGAILYDRLEETLKALSCRYDLFIVSNCQDGYVNAFLHAHHLEQYFKDYEMSGRTGLAKGGNIWLIMERNHAEKAVYVGDTMGDEEAARAAGIPFIWAQYGFGQAEAPDAVLSSIAELPKLLKTIYK